MVAPAKSLTPRTLAVLGNPLPGLVRAALTVGKQTAAYTFRRLDAGRVAVAKDDGDAYVCDLTAGACGCAAGRFGRVEECRHIAAATVLVARGHL